jgi:hypothetical protein
LLKIRVGSLSIATVAHLINALQTLPHTPDAELAIRSVF